jgi:hypothetical protein
MAIRKVRRRGELVTTEQLPMAIAWEEMRVDYCTRIGWTELAGDAIENLELYRLRLQIGS